MNYLGNWATNQQVPDGGHFTHQGTALLSNGYLIVPIRRGEKRPAIAAWQKARLGRGDLQQYPQHGVGVLCGQGAHPIVGVDVDVSHPTISPAIVDWCRKHLGCSVERVGAAPRVLLAYRAAEAGWTKRASLAFVEPTDPVKLNGEPNVQKVEVLGFGQQFVAYHVHPDTHREYEWTDLYGGLEAVHASSLPLVTETQIDALLAEVDRLVRVTAGIDIKAAQPPASAGVAESLPEHVDDARMADIAAAVRALSPARFESGAHDHSFEVLQCLKHLASCRRAEEAEALWMQTIEAHGSANKKREAAAWWRDEKVPNNKHFAKLFTLAEQDGWTNPARRLTEDVATVIAQLQEAPQQDVLSTWAMRAAAMPRDAADLVVEAVHKRTGIGRRPLNAALKEARRELKNRPLRDGDGRQRVPYEPENTAQQAARVGEMIVADGAPGDLLVFGGIPSRVRESEQPYAHAADSEDAAPVQMLIEAHSMASMRALAERHVVFTAPTAEGQRAIQQPAAIVENLLQLDIPAAPRTTGLLGHPVVTPGGEIISTNGLHAGTGLYAHGVDGADLVPYSRTQAAVAVARICELMLEGFEFGTPLDMTAALAGIFTAVQRRVLDAAPALAVLAPLQSSGKTTLARLMHLLLTDRDLPVVDFPVGNPAEIEKRILAVLMRSPPMVCFDNIEDGLTLNAASLNAALTAPTFEGRVLGLSRIVTAPTSTMFVFTGNNLTFGRDETTRFIPVNLAPTTSRPETRRFRNADVVSHGRAIRKEVLRLVVGVVAGYVRSGDAVDLGTGSRFPLWDKLIRQPLAWAGAGDVGQVFEINHQDAEHLQALRALVGNLWTDFGHEAFTARDLINSAGFEIKDALSSLRCRDTTAPVSVGRALKSNVGRVVRVDDFPMRLAHQTGRDGVGRFKVEALPLMQ